MRDAFSHVTTWVFDLDNTLYPPSARLFDQIEVKMTEFVARHLDVSHEHANHLRDAYWKAHGTTLSGLMINHQIDPDPFLDAVHDITLDHMAPAPDLRDAIRALPGRKLVYTNGSLSHGQRVTRALGLSDCFETIYGIEAAGYIPKPRAEAYQTILTKAGIEPARAAMFEDDPRNLEDPHRRGMKTVLVGEAPQAAHIHAQTTDLPDFLSQLV